MSSKKLLKLNWTPESIPTALLCDSGLFGILNLVCPSQEIGIDGFFSDESRSLGFWNFRDLQNPLPRFAIFGILDDFKCKMPFSGNSGSLTRDIKYRISFSGYRDFQALAPSLSKEIPIQILKFSFYKIWNIFEKWYLEVLLKVSEAFFWGCIIFECNFR